ncbi:MAG: hypothetical protein Q8P41_09960 [Pseudomonadota bacterium]|nr:hypothetical protein [Pseudomonadota bacterium]
MSPAEGFEPVAPLVLRVVQGGKQLGLWATIDAEDYASVGAPGGRTFEAWIGALLLDHAGGIGVLGTARLPVQVVVVEWPAALVLRGPIHGPDVDERNLPLLSVFVARVSYGVLGARWKVELVRFGRIQPGKPTLAWIAALHGAPARATAEDGAPVDPAAEAIFGADAGLVSGPLRLPERSDVSSPVDAYALDGWFDAALRLRQPIAASGRSEDPVVFRPVLEQALPGSIDAVVLVRVAGAVAGLVGMLIVLFPLMVKGQYSDPVPCLAGATHAAADGGVAGASAAMVRVERPAPDLRCRTDHGAVEGLVGYAAGVMKEAGGRLWAGTPFGAPPAPEATLTAAPVPDTRFLPVGLCSAPFPVFVDELRCQVAQAAVGVATAPCAAPPAAAADLQATFCGVLDRERDAPAFGLGAAARAVAQACYVARGRPGTYAGPVNPDGDWVDAAALLQDDGEAASTLATLVAECDTARDRVQQRVAGAILATHVGGGRNAEQVALRQSARDTASAGMAPASAACFDAGIATGWGGARWGDLCGPVPTDLAGYAAWVRFDGANEPANWAALGEGVADPRDLGTGTEPVVTRYRDARFVQSSPSVGPDATLWRCHDALVAEGRSDTVRGEWRFAVPRPARYDLAGAGARSQLALESALLGQRAGTDLGACWSEVGALLGGWEAAHPIYTALDPAGWPAPAQQLCGQACAVAWGLATPAPGHVSVTPSADVSACVTGEPPSRAGDAAFPLLRLPWNGAPFDDAREAAWTAPDALDVCAFHLVAQDTLAFARKDWLPAGMGAQAWAGESATGEAGGPNGLAYRAAQELRTAGAENRWGEQECGAAATACFAGIALEQRFVGGRLGWAGAFDSAVLATGRAREREVRTEAPWCALVLPYLAPSVQKDTLDLSCQRGVDSARGAVRGAIAARVAGQEATF